MVCGSHPTRLRLFWPASPQAPDASTPEGAPSKPFRRICFLGTSRVQSRKPSWCPFLFFLFGLGRFDFRPLTALASHVGAGRRSTQGEWPITWPLTQGAEVPLVQLPFTARKFRFQVMLDQDIRCSALDWKTSQMRSSRLVS